MTREITRDSYGLRTGTTPRVPPVRRYRCHSDEEFEYKTKTRNKLNELRAKTSSLRDAMDLNHFILVTLDRMSRLIVDDGAEATAIPGPAPLSVFDEEEDDIPGLEREIMQVDQRLRHISLENEFLQTLLRRVNQVQLTRAPDQVRKDEADVFYRYHLDSSKSEHKRNVGIVCPGWRKGGSADAKITEDHVRQHLTKDDRSSPPFISVSDSPGKAYNIMKGKHRYRPGPGKVFIISRRKLQKMEVDSKSTIEIARDFGIEKYSSKSPNGVHYISEFHWLIHRWVPEECIEREMSEYEFETFCDAHRITFKHPGMTSLCRYKLTG